MMSTMSPIPLPRAPSRFSSCLPCSQVQQSQVVQVGPHKCTILCLDLPFPPDSTHEETDALTARVPATPRYSAVLCLLLLLIWFCCWN